jgi:hypothetical protein
MADMADPNLVEGYQYPNPPYNPNYQNYGRYAPQTDQTQYYAQHNTPTPDPEPKHPGLVNDSEMETGPDGRSTELRYGQAQMWCRHQLI